MTTYRSVNSDNASHHQISDVAARISDASRQLFSTQGYSATSLRQIASQAGVTKPMIYYYFGSKEGLFDALLEHSLSTLQSLVSEALATATDTRTRLLAMAQMHQRAAREQLGTVRFIAAASLAPGPAVAPATCRRLQAMQTEHLLRVMQQGIDAAELRPGDPARYAVMARSLFNIFYEAALHDVPLPEGEDLPAWLVESLLGGIGVSSS